MPIFFTDDNLFTSRKRAKQLAEGIIQNDLHFKWRAFFRTDAISEDNVEVLAKSGCMVAYLGIESGDDKVLKAMKKQTTREQNLKAVKLLDSQGIGTISTLIIGFPEETRESVDNSISLLNSFPDSTLPIHKYYPFVFLLFPLSPIASPENRRKYKIEGGYENWSHSTMNSEEAKEQFLRLFKEVEIPPVAYLEFIDREIPLTKIKDISRTRDLVVKDGINVINQNNILKIYKKFNNILENEKV
jgi:radical SAM superfamily enzyme YgiQ (UPF0313 family)